MSASIIDTCDDFEAMLRNVHDASQLLKALSNEKRLLMLCLLADGEKTVTELESLLALRQPTVSQQLARLRAQEIVSCRRKGKTMHYSLASNEARRLMGLIHEMFGNAHRDQPNGLTVAR